jgi:glucose-6-phosphate isomerase
MIYIDFSGIPFASQAEKIEPFLAQFKAKDQGFFDVLDEDISELEKFVAKQKPLERTVVLGIGGSALGAKMLRDALGGHNLAVLDTIDPVAVESVENLEQTRFIVISKSGTTLETKQLLNYFWDKAPHENFIIITQRESELWTWAETNSVPTVPMPGNIGGRFSVLTTVGIVPGLFAGIDMKAVIEGAKNMRTQFLSKENNLPFKLASSIMASGKTKLVHFPYVASLQTMGDWWTQLVAESTGKQGKGFTPISAVGPTDQHSLLQLLTEGPDEFCTIFVKDQSYFSVPLGKIANTELRATAQSLTELSRPNCTLEIDAISPETIGELIALWMGTVAFLGEFLNINVFDQPGVERGKVITKEMMKEV